MLMTPFLGVTQSRQQIWTATDRQNLLVGLKTSQSGILKEVEHLNEKQIYFKPDQASRFKIKISFRYLQKPKPSPPKPYSMIDAQPHAFSRHESSHLSLYR